MHKPIPFALRFGILSFALVSVLAHGSAYAAAPAYSWKCPGLPSTTAKAAIFIDMNGSVHEMNAAGAAACARGERFYTIPSIEVIEEVGPLREKMELAHSAYDAVKKECEAKKCSPTRIRERDALYDRYYPLTVEFSQIAKKYEYKSTQELDSLLARLEANQEKLGSLVISGHHVTNYYGDLTPVVRLGDAQLAHLIRKHVPIFEDLNFVGLWGCGGLTRKDITTWRALLPNLRVLAGFFASAPLGMRPASSSYLYDASVKTAALSSAKSPAATESLIRTIRGIDDTFHAIYVENEKSRKGVFDYNTAYDSKTKQMIHFFETFGDDSRCVAYREQLPETRPLIESYLAGETPLPSDGANSPLRKYYFNLMQNGDCLKESADALSIPKLALLRFFEKGVKVNFNMTFSEVIWNGVDELKKSNIPLPTELRTLEHELSQFTELDRREMISIVKSWEAAALASPNLTAELPKTSRLLKAMRMYLVDLDPRCMDFVSWHVAVTTHTAEPRCNP